MRLTVRAPYTDFGLMSLGLNVRFGSKSRHVQCKNVWVSARMHLRMFLN